MTDAFRRCSFLGFPVIIIASVLFVGWSRSRTVTSLREENRALREQLETAAAAQSEIEDLQALRDHLRRSIDAFALENQSLRSENNKLCEQTNQLARLRIALENSRIKQQGLEHKILKLQAEVDAKPSVP